MFYFSKLFSDLILYISLLFSPQNFSFSSVLSFLFIPTTVLFSFSSRRNEHFLYLNPKLLNEFLISIFTAVIFFAVYKGMKLQVFQTIVRYFVKLKVIHIDNLYIELLWDKREGKRDRSKPVLIRCCWGFKIHSFTSFALLYIFFAKIPHFFNLFISKKSHWCFSFLV